MLTLSSSFFLRALLQHKRNTFIRRISLRSACTRCSGEYAMHGGRLCASSTLQHSLPLAFFLPPLGVHTATLLKSSSLRGRGGPPITHTHTYIHTHTCTHTIDTPSLPPPPSHFNFSQTLYICVQLWVHTGDVDEGAVEHDLQQLVGLTADGVGIKVPVVDHPGRDDGCVLVVTAATVVRTIIVTQSSRIALRF